MWRRRTNKSSGDSGPYKSITVKFNTSCMKCAMRVPARTKAYYDVDCKRVICSGCVKLLNKGLEPVSPPSPAQTSIDRIQQILAVGGPTNEQRAEFEQLVNSLKVDYAAERIAQNFLGDFYEVPKDESFICMSIRRDDLCTGCTCKLTGGSVAVWDKGAHRMWCLDCAADFTLD